jgi:hypothetical protein
MSSFRLGSRRRAPFGPPTAGVALLAMLAGAPALAAPNASEGAWAAERRLCGVAPEAIEDPAKHPIEVTSEAINWSSQRCAVIRKSGRNGVFQVRAACTAGESVNQQRFRLVVRGDRLTVIFANGARERYVRCP